MNEIVRAMARQKEAIRRIVIGRKAQYWRMKVLGQNVNDGWIAKIIIYVMISSIAFLYLQPFLYMISTMFKNLSDLLDPTVKWIPRTLDWHNLMLAWNGLNYPKALLNTITIALLGSIFQMVTCALTGYALARLRFPGRKLAIFIVIITFLVPPQVVILPMYVLFSKLGLLHSFYAFLAPALLGQGVRSALFIIIFMNFFKKIPLSLEEAAKLDGASTIRMFFRVVIPISRAATLVVFLFSFIWYWNMSYEPSMFLTPDLMPLSVRLDGLESAIFGIDRFMIHAKNQLSEGPKMAGAFLIVFPPLLLYSVMQRWFTEGIERTGLVE